MEQLFFFQLVGVIGIGGFAGEFYRSANQEIIVKVFMANMLAGSFLSFLIAYSVYTATHNKSIAIIIGGLLSYQDEKYISNISKSIINRGLGGKENDD